MDAIKEREITDRDMLDKKILGNKNTLMGAENFYYDQIKTISLSSILVGALVGIGISFILNLLAMAIGITVITQTAGNLGSLAIGGFIGLALITIVSTGIAGWISGYLGRSTGLRRYMGVLYGFSAWCMALVLMVGLSSNFDRFISYNVAALQTPSHVLLNDASPGIKTVYGLNTIATQTAVTNAQPATTNQVKFNKQAEANALTLSSFLVFLLAVIGGLSSCVGGHLGFRSFDKTTPYYKDFDTKI